jgi:hypothetical protein
LEEQPLVKSFLVLVALVLLAAHSAGQQSKDQSWDAWRFLLGDWVGEGDGQPGQASSGGFSFAFDLQGKVLVRRNHAEYAATGDRPAFRHDDLMVIYDDSRGKGKRAIYFDNEGHVINYEVTVSQDLKTLTFIGDTPATGPRFRFIYNKVTDDALRFRFDIAPPGKPDAFTKYIEGTARRK